MTRDRAIELAGTAKGFAMLKQIEDERAENGRCSYAAIMPDDPDWCPEGPLFAALETLRLVDSDIDGEGRGVVNLTSKGRAYLMYAGSDFGQSILEGT